MGLVVLILFIALPIAELYVIIQVAGGIGLAPTLALLILDGFLGAALARSQGRVAWQRFNLALAESRVPAKETFDGAMIIVGGALLLAPGFITDIVGFALLIPPTRAVFRTVVARLARRRVGFAWTVTGPGPGAAGRRPGPSGPSDPRSAPGRDYDYEGTAREVGESEAELEGGDRDD
jgi:UPF0716 protein FxsA